MQYLRKFLSFQKGYVQATDTFLTTRAGMLNVWMFIFSFNHSSGEEKLGMKETG